MLSRSSKMSNPVLKLFPAPDFIVKIVSPTIETIDRTLKMTDYTAHGVTEYWMIDPVQQSVE